MKRKKILSFLLLVSLLLTACTDNEKKITAVYNYDINVGEYFIDVSSDQVLNLVDSGNEFIFFMWQEGCSGCETAMPIIEEYLTDEGCQQSIYRFEYSHSGYEPLITKHPEMFPNEVNTPRMFTVKDGEIAYEINDSRLEYKITLKSSLNQFTEFANLYYLSKYEAYELFREEFGETTTYIYNSKDLDSCQEYRAEFEKARVSEETTLFIDEVTADDELKIALGIEVVTSEDEAIEEAEEE